MRRLIVIGLGSVLLLGSLRLYTAYAEEITLTTYYPAPYGVYDQMLSGVLGVGDTNGDGVLDSNDAPDPNDPDQANDVWIAGQVGIGTTNPQATLDVNGTVSMFGVWGDRDGDGSPDGVEFSTTYRAATDGFVLVMAFVTGGAGSRLRIYGKTGSSAGAMIARASVTAWDAADAQSFMMPVRKGDYWRADISISSGNTDTSLVWISLGK